MRQQSPIGRANWVRLSSIDFWFGIVRLPRAGFCSQSSSQEQSKAGYNEGQQIILKIA